jgi:hypothetical protein
VLHQGGRFSQLTQLGAGQLASWSTGLICGTAVLVHWTRRQRASKCGTAGKHELHHACGMHVFDALSTTPQLVAAARLAMLLQRLRR